MGFQNGDLLLESLDFLPEESVVLWVLGNVTIDKGKEGVAAEKLAESLRELTKVRELSSLLSRTSDRAPLLPSTKSLRSDGLLKVAV